MARRKRKAQVEEALTTELQSEAVVIGTAQVDTTEIFEGVLDASNAVAVMAEQEAAIKIYGNFHCIHCGSEDVTPMSHLPATIHQGRLRDGTRYTAVRRTRVKCDICNGWSANVFHEFDPSKWRGK